MKGHLKQLSSYRLKSLLQQKGYSQARLAKETGIAKSTIHDYIKGHSFVSEKNQQLIAQTLQITPQDLVLETSAVYTSQEQQEPAFIVMAAQQPIVLSEQDSFDQRLYQIGDCLFLKTKTAYDKQDVICYQDNNKRMCVALYDNQPNIIGVIVAKLSIYDEDLFIGQL